MTAVMAMESELMRYGYRVNRSQHKMTQYFALPFLLSTALTVWRL